MICILIQRDTIVACVAGLLCQLLRALYFTAAHGDLQNPVTGLRNTKHRIQGDASCHSRQKSPLIIARPNAKQANGLFLLQSDNVARALVVDEFKKCEQMHPSVSAHQHLRLLDDTRASIRKQSVVCFGYSRT